MPALAEDGDGEDDDDDNALGYGNYVVLSINLMLSGLNLGSH